MTRNRKLVALVLVVCAAAAARVQASNVISADFVYSDTGVGPISGDTTLTPGTQSNTDGLIFTGQSGPWNSVVTGTNNGNNNYAFAGPLVDGNGNPTSVTFTLGAADGSGGDWRGNYTTTTVPLLRADTPTDSNPNPYPESAYLYNQFGLTGDHFTWELSGLKDGGTYNLVMFGDGSVPGGTTHTANGVSAVLDSEGDWNWAGIHADGSGNILGLFTDPSPTSGLVGFQIQQVINTPEPGTLLMAAIGLLGMTIVLRRRRAA